VPQKVRSGQVKSTAASAAKVRPGGEFRLATDDPTYLTEPLVKSTNMRLNPRPLTPEQRKVIDERNRVDAPPVQMVFTIDGRQMLSAVVEGSTDYNYARGETIVPEPRSK